jgi:plasmid maintenance system antidote protein VapI
LREEEPALTVRIAIRIDSVFDETNKLKLRLLKRYSKKHQTEAK